MGWHFICKVELTENEKIHLDGWAQSYLIGYMEGINEGRYIAHRFDHLCRLPNP